MKSRKRSEAFYDCLCRVDSSTPIIDDLWLCEWTPHPPDDLLHRQTLFQTCAPRDISKNGWTILVPAVREIGKAFGIAKPAARNDTSSREEPRVLGFEWLSLNRYRSRQCVIGLNDDVVVAAAVEKCNRQPFSPVSAHEALRKREELQNLVYRLKHRGLQARFDLSNTPDMRYIVNTSVHGTAYLWATLRVDDFIVPLPLLLTLTEDLSDLSAKIIQINNECQQFKQKLEMTLGLPYGGEYVFRHIRKLIENTAVPYYVLDTLRHDKKLGRCLTKRDILLAIMRALDSKSDDLLPSLIPLSRKITQTERKQHERKKDRAKTGEHPDRHQQ